MPAMVFVVLLQLPEVHRIYYLNLYLSKLRLRNRRKIGLIVIWQKKLNKYKKEGQVQKLVNFIEMVNISGSFGIFFAATHFRSVNFERPQHKNIYLKKLPCEKMYFCLFSRSWIIICIATFEKEMVTNYFTASSDLRVKRHKLNLERNRI